MVHGILAPDYPESARVGPCRIRIAPGRRLRLAEPMDEDVISKGSTEGGRR